MLAIYRPPSVQVVTLPGYATCPAATNSSFCHPDIPEAACDTYPDPCPHFIVRGWCNVTPGLTYVKYLWHLNLFFCKKNIFSLCLRFSFLSETPKLFFANFTKLYSMDGLQKSGPTFVIAYYLWLLLQKRKRGNIFSRPNKLTHLLVAKSWHHLANLEQRMIPKCPSAILAIHIKDEHVSWGIMRLRTEYTSCFALTLTRSLYQR